MLKDAFLWTSWRGSAVTIHRNRLILLADSEDFLIKLLLQNILNDCAHTPQRVFLNNNLNAYPNTSLLIVRIHFQFEKRTYCIATAFCRFMRLQIYKNNDDNCKFLGTKKHFLVLWWIAVGYRLYRQMIRHWSTNQFLATLNVGRSISSYQGSCCRTSLFLYSILQINMFNILIEVLITKKQFCLQTLITGKRTKYWKYMAFCNTNFNWNINRS